MNVSDAESNLRARIEEVFPAERCHGPITRFDGHHEEEFDEDQLLYQGLLGRTWKEISGQFIREHPGGLVLLTPEAFVAFLPAWLLFALDDMAGENEVRSFVIYVFSPKTELLPNTSSGIRDRFGNLNAEQQKTTRKFLAYCYIQEQSEFLRARAKDAVDFMETQ